MDGAGVNAIHAAGKQVYPWFNTSETGDAAQDVISLGTDGVITNWTFKYRQLRGKEPLPKGTKFRVSDSTMLYASAGAHAAGESGPAGQHHAAGQHVGNCDDQLHSELRDRSVERLWRESNVRWADPTDRDEMEGARPNLCGWRVLVQSRRQSVDRGPVHEY